MRKQKEVVIQNANVSTISISGTVKQNPIMREKFEEFKSSAVKMGGYILNEKSFSDGFFIEVLFKTEEEKASWEKHIGI